MKKTVILSTNDHLDYINYLPHTIKAWNMLGWDTLTFYLGTLPMVSSEQNRIIYVNSIDGYKDCTVVQVIRLLAHRYVDGLIMLGDVDMIPMSNYWKPNPDNITCYGIDLTGDNQIPMCYVAANADNWDKIIPEKDLIELLQKYPNAKHPDFDKYWFVDQNILTERILHNGLPFDRIDRGIVANLARGRVDRADWKRTINMPTEKIDAHMPRPFNLEQTERILKMVIV